MHKNVPLSWAEMSSWLPEAKLLNSELSNFVFPFAHQIKTDTRSLVPGDWFMPLQGERFDGHNFFDIAIANKVGGLWCASSRTDKLKNIPQGVPVIVVNDTLKALQYLARGYRLRFSGLTVVAITGSTGKTSVKEMIRSILAQQDDAYLLTEANFNNEIGLPLTLLKLKPNHKFAILEMGARHPDDIKFLMDIAQPQIGCLLNVGHAHLAIFGDLETLISTKWQVIEHLPPTGTAIINTDQELLRNRISRLHCHKILFGRSSESHIRVISEDWRSKALTVDLEINGDIYTLHPQSPHDAFAINAAAAASIGIALGLKPKTLVSGLDAYISSAGRFSLLNFKQIAIIDDAYNANPASMISGLRTLARLYPDHPKFLVLGDMLELGEESPLEHRKIGAFGSHLKPLTHIFAVGAFAEDVCAAVKEEGLSQVKFSAHTSVEDLISVFPDLPQKCVVFIKGSHGVNLSKLVEHLKMRYS